MSAIDTRTAILERFGEDLAARRRELGLSQEALALRAGLHRTYIGSVERAERNPTLTTLVRLAHALDCGPADLLSGVAEARP